jgi:hypothetical protein
MTDRIIVDVRPGDSPRATRQIIDALVDAGIGTQTHGFYDPVWLADAIERTVELVKLVRGDSCNTKPTECTPTLARRVIAVWPRDPDDHVVRR